MEKKFSQSYSKRENALFNEMRSRRLQKWWNNRWSKIDPQERFWLILFTRPSRSDDSNEWVVKFWLWDSEENKLKCENFLSFSYRPTESGHELLTWTSSSLAECYIEKQYEKIVIRPKGCKCYFMYDFNGTFITQTESETPSCDDEQESFSKFLNEKLFFSKTGHSMTIYELNKQKNLQPRKINLLGTTKIRFWQCFSNYENVNFYYPEDMKYFIVSAWEHSPEGGP